MMRWFCKRRQFLWILFLLIVVCITLHTFVTQKARDVKLTGLLLLRSSISKQKKILPLGLLSESSREGKQEIRSEQTEQITNLHHQNKGNGESSADRLLKVINLAPGSQMEAGTSLKQSLEKIVINTSSRVLNSCTNRVYYKATCHPVSHIVFLKTHKTASSTILNILYRYGECRNLTFALPLNKRSQMFYPRFFASHFVESFSGQNSRDFHIMCNHMRFKKSEVAKVMPKETFYFSILRHPVAMMESIFIYYKSIPAFRKINSLEDFLDTCWKDYNSSLTNNQYAHNILAFDFGFDNTVEEGAEDLDDRAAKAVTAIERDFHLIIISDYFEESMILLKHALCWSLEDIVSFRLNSRNEQTRNKVSPESAAKIKRWNALDWRIYLHFNATFWHRMESLVGLEKMKREVSQLKVLQAKLTNTCLKDGGAVDPSEINQPDLKPFQYGAAVIQGYNLNPYLDRQTKTECQRLITPELQYTKHLYAKQFPDVVAKLRQTTKTATSQH